MLNLAGDHTNNRVWLNVSSLVLFVGLLFSLVQIAHAARVGYEYDSAGRLKKVTYPDTGTKDYTLDPAGNRTQVQAQVPLPDTTRPSSPGAVSFSNLTVNSLTVNWGAASDNVGVVGYDYLVNGGAWQSLGSVLTVGLSGLASGTSYTVQVRARDAAGNTSSAPSVNSVTTPSLALAVPQWVGVWTSCTPSCLINDHLSLVWTSVSGATFYELERSTGWDLSAMSPFAPHYSGGSTSYFQSWETRTLYPGYDAYRVRACNVSGCSTYSPVISIGMDIGI